MHIYSNNILLHCFWILMYFELKFWARCAFLPKAWIILYHRYIINITIYENTSHYLHGWVLDFFSYIIEVVPAVVSPQPSVKCSGDVPQGISRSFEYIFQMLGITCNKAYGALPSRILQHSIRRITVTDIATMHTAHYRHGYCNNAYGALPSWILQQSIRRITVTDTATKHTAHYRHGYCNNAYGALPSRIQRWI